MISPGTKRVFTVEQAKEFKNRQHAGPHLMTSETNILDNVLSKLFALLTYQGIPIALDREQTSLCNSFTFC